jgi:aldehyde dehydrogenase (NAD+)
MTTGTISKATVEHSVGKNGSNSAPVSPEEMKRIFLAQKKKSLELRFSTAKQRIEKLKKIRDLIYKYQTEIQTALRTDFNKSEAETDITEILPTIGECKDAIRHLKTWMRPLRVGTPLTLFGSVSEVHYEPRGVCLIISPWNYPFHLAFAPLIAAVAAGNTVIIKPSEYTPATSGLTKKMLKEIFLEEEVAVLEGDYTVSTALTDLPFDHIFFTGSTNVGKIIMERAAKHLTSVTLELGGKSPAIITEESNLARSAESIIWGKFLNAGQTCVAPDYLLVPESKLEGFVAEAKKSVQKFFGNSQSLKESKDFCRIVNSRNFERVKGYIEDAVSKGAKIEMGGETDSSQNFIEPTLLSKVPLESKIMQDEIFGPLLPIITYKSLDEAIDFVNSKPKPLALYIFSKAAKKIKKILKATSSGGAVVNDVIIHLANSNLPFGGVNHSGHGSYHGFFGFKEFSHERAVLKQAPIPSVKMMYPPYTNIVRKMVDATTRYFL